MDKNKASKSIRTRLDNAFISLAIIPLIFLGIILIWQSYSIQKEQSVILQNEILDKAITQINDLFINLENNLKFTIASTNLINQDLKTQSNIISKIQTYSYRQNIDSYNEVTLLDENGKELIRASRTKFFSKNDLKNKNISDEFIIPSTTGNTYFSPIYFDEKTGEPFILMGIPIININNGALKGVIVCEIRIRSIWNLIATISLGKEGSVYIADATGKIIAHKNPSIVLKSTSFVILNNNGFHNGLYGNKSLITSKELKIGSQSFYFIAEQPITEALSIPIRITVIISILILIAISGTILLGFIITNQVIYPIESLATTAELISNGYLNTKAEESLQNEFGTLSKAFNIMTKQLVENINSLKQSIIDRDNATHELEKSHSRFLTVMDSLDTIVYVSDLETHEILFMNQYGKNIFGNHEGKICQEMFKTEQNSPCDFCKNKNFLTSNSESKGVFVWEYKNEKNNRWYFVHARAIKWINKQWVILEIATDITERKISEEHIKTSLEEKELLLKEIHHRVKNNMQIISSILNLQSGYTKDEDTIGILKECRDRIFIMALIHEKLYQSKNLSKIDFEEYLKELIVNLFISYGAKNEIIKIETNSKDIFLNINIAIPCGLIINELVSNCFKHAFPNERKGEIKIDIFYNDNNFLILIINDNGIGLPENFDIYKSDSLGLKLVISLVNQLNGNIEVIKQNGTTFKISFPS